MKRVAYQVAHRQCDHFERIVWMQLEYLLLHVFDHRSLRLRGRGRFIEEKWRAPHRSQWH